MIFRVLFQQANKQTNAGTTFFIETYIYMTIAVQGVELNNKDSTEATTTTTTTTTHNIVDMTLSASFKSLFICVYTPIT